MTTSAIAALLNNIPTVYAVPFAATLGLLSYHLATFCSDDPPGYPTWSATDFAALLSLNDFDAFLAAQGKLKDMVDTYVWYQSCHCDVGTTPGPPTPPAAPTGMPTINPPTVSTPFATGTPCLSTATTGAVTTGAPGGTGPNQPLNGATYSDVQVTQYGANPSSGSYRIAVQYLNAAGGFVGFGSFFNFLTTGYQVGTGGAIPAGATQFNITQSNVGAYVGTNSWEGTFDFYCGTTPGGSGPVPIPCQTDPSIQLVLSQILQLLTLVQRNAVPFAYVPGATHSGLSGSGVITIPRCLGALVTLTTVPTNVGIEIASPDVVWNAGSVSWGNTDGYTDRVWVTHNPQLEFPEKAEQWTRLAYSFSAGVVASIRELYAET